MVLLRKTCVYTRYYLASLNMLWHVAEKYTEMCSFSEQGNQHRNNPRNDEVVIDRTYEFDTSGNK